MLHIAKIYIYIYYMYDLFYIYIIYTQFLIDVHTAFLRFRDWQQEAAPNICTKRRRGSPQKSPLVSNYDEVSFDAQVYDTVDLPIGRCLSDFVDTLWLFNIAMENHHIIWENPL